jgi:hypothetical protein
MTYENESTGSFISRTEEGLKLFYLSKMTIWSSQLTSQKSCLPGSMSHKELTAEWALETRLSHPNPYSQS